METRTIDRILLITVLVFVVYGGILIFSARKDGCEMRNFIGEIREAAKAAGMSSDDIVCIAVRGKGRIFWEHAVSALKEHDYEPGDSASSLHVSRETVVLFSGGKSLFRTEETDDGFEGWKVAEKGERGLGIPNADIDPSELFCSPPREVRK